MHVQVDIELGQLIKIVRELPARQLNQLRAAIDQDKQGAPESYNTDNIDLETLLLNGPTASKEQIATIAQNHKAVNQWRVQQ